MYTIFAHSQWEALFNSPDLGDLKGGVAPFFNTLLDPTLTLPRHNFSHPPVLARVCGH